MAVDLSKLVSKRRIELQELNGKLIAVDAYNVLYQFLSIIRGPDGTPLMDSHHNVTSHLSGLFYRNIELMGFGIKPVYVFDGIPSMLKQKTIEARMKRREEAREAWKEALEKGELAEAKMHAQGSTRLTKEIVESGKRLLDYMGVPYINAPSEGEAQASRMCRDRLVYAVGSQDYDTMLFAAPKVVRNLTISGKRKLPKKNIYINVEPELMDFNDTIASLGISHRQLIWIGLMLGTDYNAGIKGIGPKTALKIAKESSSIADIEKYVKEKGKEGFELDPKEVEAMFLDPEVREISEKELESIMSKRPDIEKITRFMCDEHEFSQERIAKYAEKLVEAKGAARQKGIGGWIGKE